MSHSQAPYVPCSLSRTHFARSVPPVISLSRTHSRAPSLSCSPTVALPYLPFSLSLGRIRALRISRPLSLSDAFRALRSSRHLSCSPTVALPYLPFSLSRSHSRAPSSSVSPMLSLSRSHSRSVSPVLSLLHAFRALRSSRYLSCSPTVALPYLPFSLSRSHSRAPYLPSSLPRTHFARSVRPVISLSFVAPVLSHSRSLRLSCSLSLSVAFTCSVFPVLSLSFAFTFSIGSAIYCGRIRSLCRSPALPPLNALSLSCPRALPPSNSLSLSLPCSPTVEFALSVAPLLSHRRMLSLRRSRALRRSNSGSQLLTCSRSSMLVASVTLFSTPYGFPLSLVLFSLLFCLTLPPLLSSPPLPSPSPLRTLSHEFTLPLPPLPSSPSLPLPLLLPLRAILSLPLLLCLCSVFHRMWFVVLFADVVQV
ncbi:unnamed protein product [Closterium sp. Yama58-4]|nr:unnamed protein product [Closterium sp. Yama58-4]